MRRHAPGIAGDMLIWRPIMRGKCTLHELRTVYSFDDLADMHEALNLEDAMAALPALKKGGA